MKRNGVMFTTRISSLGNSLRLDRSRVTPWIIFLLAALIRGFVLLIVFHYHNSQDMLNLTPDSSNYVGGAQAIISDGFLVNRRELFYFPVGYPLLLAVSFLLWGIQTLPILAVQVLLSSWTCVLIYLIALEAGLTRRVAFIAGLLGVFSITSIALSSLVLSDTVYVFLFAFSLWLLIRALHTGRLHFFLLAGTVCGGAMLVRPIGKYWPFVMVLVTLGYHFVQRARTDFRAPDLARLLRGAILGCLIACLIPVPWVIRNYRVHGFPVMAITTISARSTIAAKAMGNVVGQDYRKVQQEWEQEYLSKHAGQPRLLEGLCHQAQIKTQEVESEYPLEVVGAYAEWSWENISEPDYLLPILLPPASRTVDTISGFLRDHGLLRARFYLSIAGLIILIFGRHYRATLFLGAVYGYCACTIGAFPYQGSRYFLPGQLSGWILMATTIVFMVMILIEFTHRIQRFAKTSLNRT
ncbi:MAG: glycosyltransferase family 39 protein [candidate division Zixibacteria bacterium]|nr:glycosyltransferase family 39 protein [candidate division Zixibacteria bacterium]